MTNEYGLDASYFKCHLQLIVDRVDRYTPSEMQRALTCLATVAEQQKSYKDPEAEKRVMQQENNY